MNRTLIVFGILPLTTCLLLSVLLSLVLWFIRK